VLQVSPALLQERERRAQRLLLGFVISGLFFMLLPGTFLGVWNLIAISGHKGAPVSAAWIQAHGHAQIFGWIGSFILGIGFYSIPKMTGRRIFGPRRGWIALSMWSVGVLPALAGRSLCLAMEIAFACFSGAGTRGICHLLSCTAAASSRDPQGRRKQAAAGMASLGDGWDFRVHAGPAD
jgi:hypothetical protein